MTIGFFTEPDKSADRIPRINEKTDEEILQDYALLLPKGKTCNDCVYVKRCVTYDTFLKIKKTDTSCRFPIGNTSMFEPKVK